MKEAGHSVYENVGFFVFSPFFIFNEDL